MRTGTSLIIGKVGITLSFPACAVEKLYIDHSLSPLPLPLSLSLLLFLSLSPSLSLSLSIYLSFYLSLILSLEFYSNYELQYYCTTILNFDCVFMLDAFQKIQPEWIGCPLDTGCQSSKPHISAPNDWCSWEGIAVLSTSDAGFCIWSCLCLVCFQPSYCQQARNLTAQLTIHLQLN